MQFFVDPIPLSLKAFAGNITFKPLDQTVDIAQALVSGIAPIGWRLQGLRGAALCRCLSLLPPRQTHLDNGGCDENESEQQNWGEKPRGQEITEIPKQGADGL